MFRNSYLPLRNCRKMFYFSINLLQIFLISNFAVCVYVPVTTENIKASDISPQETQHAVCKVFTKEIEASAKATITRQLKGVCSSKDLNVQFTYIQTIFQELQDIKKALGIQLGQNHYKSLMLPLTTTILPTSDLPVYDSEDYWDLENDMKYLNSPSIKNQKFSDVKQNRNTDGVNFSDEISMYNDTIVESSEGNLYFYYWKISDIGRVLKKRNIYVSSPSFSVLGHMLHLQCYPNYMDEYIGILLKPDSNSFLKKHKIIFLGQSSTQNQISSKTLYGIKNEEKIFKVEPEMLDKHFIIHDSLLVKLQIYLNS